MAYQAASGTFTYVATNETIEIGVNEGIVALSVVCTSSTTGTIIGSAKFKALSPEAITLNQNVPYSCVAAAGKVLDGITLTAPAGCDLVVTLTT